MEGRTTAVSTSLVLPAQPTTGDVRYIPLGGNGYTAPFAAYNIIGMSLTGAVGGGAANLAVTLDDRYCSLVSYVSIGDAQATPGDADVSIFLSANSLGMPPQAFAEPVVALSATMAQGGGTIRRTWSPVPVILAGGDKTGLITFRMLNVDADVYTLSALIYLFNIRVREMTPMGPLLWSRGAI